MNNKGFTLIELIATIALLAIISIISFVSVNAVVEKNKVNDCNSLAGSIKTAAKEYMSDNRYNRNFINGISNYKYELDASTLISNNYLTSPIVNPFTKEVIAPNTIKIEVELYNNYTVKSVSIKEPSLLINCTN